LGFLLFLLLLLAFSELDRNEGIYDKNVRHLEFQVYQPDKY